MHSENEIVLECLGYQHCYGGHYRRFTYSMVAYRNDLYIFGGGDLDLIIFNKTKNGCIKQHDVLMDPYPMYIVQLLEFIFLVALQKILVIYLCLNLTLINGEK